MSSFVRRPAYYDEFKCTAGACGDNCCIGWEIDVDGDTLEQYQRVGGSFAQRLKENIDISGEAHFRMKPDGRCPFLNENNLCDIILELGEKSLCQICTDHPRFYEWYSDGMEEGVGLCCEEAARLILTGNPDLVESCQEGDTEERETEAHYFAERDAVMYSDAYKEWPFQGPDEIRRLTAFLMGLEINKEEWRLWLERLRDNAEGIAGGRAEFEEVCKEAAAGYEKLFKYFVYRYYMKSRFEGCDDYEMWFILISIQVIEMMDMLCRAENGRLSLKDRIGNCKLYSQEIEYCPENIEAIKDLLDELYPVDEDI